MLDLNIFREEINEFLQSSIDGFMTNHGSPTAIGVYTCPQSGWMSGNFNISRSLEEVGFNCPDFEFVEFTAGATYAGERICTGTFPLSTERSGI